jgi:hypothetical protein
MEGPHATRSRQAPGTAHRPHAKRAGTSQAGRAATRAAASAWPSRSRYIVSAKCSRPISMRRISLVPTPISYSLASRHGRPVGWSLMWPLPPRIWIAWPGQLQLPALRGERRQLRPACAAFGTRRRVSRGRGEEGLETRRKPWRILETGGVTGLEEFHLDAWDALALRQGGRAAQHAPVMPGRPATPVDPATASFSKLRRIVHPALARPPSRPGKGQPATGRAGTGAHVCVTAGRPGVWGACRARA